MHYRIIDSISDVLATQMRQWNLTGNPFISPEFLRNLENHECVTAQTGWQPHHIELLDDDRSVAFMPLYLKSNSYGEYVFDWSWANAYHQHGISYYPKLITAIPFTPSNGPRVLHHADYPLNSLIPALYHVVQEVSQQVSASGWHLLFTNEQQQQPWHEFDNLITRHDCQFHWHNKNYESFDDFLAALKSRKRKQIRKERAALKQKNIQFQRLIGNQIEPEHMKAFYKFYQLTYQRHGHVGYLNPEFFEQLRQQMSEHILLIRALDDDECIASALCLFDKSTLYGRYWGCQKAVDGLHFETCYYQGIEFCIEQNLSRYDPGTQGEHKISRGFEPTQTCSFHQINHPEFARAIERFCQEEKELMATHMGSLVQQQPFNANSS
ncbi:GNAT family N-acetyltransferase [Echinimonas agarilytica]|uniref:GNAT family N-acetyltransferase n=1 Tax=Echinimonas agarilytica TaxID=1215918 RepID=A0AA41W5Z1_9GAMM|nr:GNAT family N-acetyltransferase [Echinimonas agarilytica]MCM2679515.1 GNAT family N-acetyltransferase [Echinimonas agarilytica]